MGEARTELDRHTAAGAKVQEDLDPGAYIGQQPELASERLPGGVQADDERVAAYDSAHGVPGEPDANATTDLDRNTRTGDARDAVEGDIGSARLRAPSDIEREQIATIGAEDLSAITDR